MSYKLTLSWAGSLRRLFFEAVSHSARQSTSRFVYNLKGHHYIQRLRLFVLSWI
jgi:hypothetical protein